MLSYARQVESLERLAEQLGSGASVGTPTQAAWFGEVVLLAVPYPPTREIIKLLGQLESKIIIDCSIPPVAMKNQSAAERIADWAGGAHVVKAYANVVADLLNDPEQRFDQLPVLFYCGSDPLAKQVVARLIRDSGFEPVDAGPLTSARHIEHLGPLWHALRDAGLTGYFVHSLLRAH